VKFRIAAAIGLCGSLLGACSAGVGDDPAASEGPAGEQSADIVRGRVENRLPQVVLVRINGYNGTTLCSGTYFDSRMVVTAAHCVRADAIEGQTYVYFGQDYTTDSASLPAIPEPGQRSKWARVETTVVNPSYDPGVNYVDIAVMFLDRELPFEPLHLNRRRVSDAQKLATIAGWGGSKALVPDISQVEGAGIKRSGIVKLLGSPTEADFHDDDPNPGILDPAIRKNLIKTEGHAPYSNTCAGDSGGPLLTDGRGAKEVSGVSMWTGLSCEDYSIFTRVDPFLPFFDDQSTRNGDAGIVPRLECVQEGADGALTARFSYKNDNSVTVGIPYGFRNFFPQDRAGARPSEFAPGDNIAAFKVPFGSNRSLTWQLDPRHGSRTVVTAKASSPRCDPNDVNIACADRCAASLAAECVSPGIAYTSCMTNCMGETAIFDDPSVNCGAEWRTYMGCVSDLPPAAENWDCSLPGFTPFTAPGVCEDELINAFVCAGFL
jgi:hypothetical protein